MSPLIMIFMIGLHYSTNCLTILTTAQFLHGDVIHVLISGMALAYCTI